MTPRRLVMVVGTGRSGTSLAMQALAALGASVPSRTVAPSPQNPHGPLEPIVMRDIMLSLHTALGKFDGLRPPGWTKQEPAAIAAAQVHDFIGRLLDKSDADVIAIKFPLASIYLPLWLEAAKVHSCELRLIWATRGVVDTYASFARAYPHGAEKGLARILQRTYYLLREAPGETLLLPFESWATDPPGQMAALAEAAGLPCQDIAAPFDPDVTAKAPNRRNPASAPVFGRLDRLLGMKRLRLKDLRASDPAAFERVVERMKDELQHISSTSAAPGTEAGPDEGSDAALRERLATLEAEHEQRRALSRSLIEAHDREVEALQKSEALVAAQLAEQINIATRHVNRVKQLEAQLADAQAVLAGHRPEDVPAHTIQSHPLYIALGQRSREQSLKLAKMSASKRWRMGELGARVKKNPLRILTLPFELIALAFSR